LSAPRVLLVAPDRSYRTAAFVGAGRALGIPLTVASWGRAPLALDSGGIRLDPDSPEASLFRIRDAAVGSPFSAVLATDDVTVLLAHEICLDLGLPTNDPPALHASTSKLRFRELCDQHGLFAPRYTVVSPGSSGETNLQSVQYPCVAKPLSLSASRGVIRCDSREVLEQAIPRIQALVKTEDSGEDCRVLIEDYVEGNEYSVEALLRDSKLEVIAVFEKPDPLTGPYFEETIYLTPPRLSEETLSAIHGALSGICRALGFREGPLHAELRLQGEEICFIEVASRTIGGRCGKVIEFLTGASLEALVLSHAVRRPLSQRKAAVACGVMMIPVPHAGVLRRVEGITAARTVQGIVSVEIDVREGQRLAPWPEGGPYPGFIFALGDSTDRVEASLRKAHAHLRFVTAPELAIQVW
jgi:biotin carboxylase|tara:strand:+ start:69164 stop:70402 length:1239 start_codon:yes stop_codon:yes gene_type:complete